MFSAKWRPFCIGLSHIVCFIVTFRLYHSCLVFASHFWNFARYNYSIDIESSYDSASKIPNLTVLTRDLTQDFAWTRTESHLIVGPGPSQVVFTKENHRDSLKSRRKSWRKSHFASLLLASPGHQQPWYKWHNKKGSCLPQGRISTTCAITVLRNNIKWTYALTFFLNKFRTTSVTIRCYINYASLGLHQGSLGFVGQFCRQYLHSGTPRGVGKYSFEMQTHLVLLGQAIPKTFYI